MIGRPSWRLPRCGRCPMRQCRIAEEPPAEPRDWSRCRVFRWGPVPVGAQRSDV